MLFHDTRVLLGKDGQSMYRSALSLRELGLVYPIGCSVYSPNELQAVVSKFDLDVFASFSAKFMN